MSERLWEIDPLTGMKTFFSFDDDTEEFTLRSEHDVTGILEDNRRQQNNEPDRFKGDVHRVASIPLALYFDLKKQGIVGDQKRLKAWLNDSENQFFRTKLGRV